MPSEGNTKMSGILQDVRGAECARQERYAELLAGQVRRHDEIGREDCGSPGAGCAQVIEQSVELREVDVIDEVEDVAAGFRRRNIHGIVGNPERREAQATEFDLGSIDRVCSDRHRIAGVHQFARYGQQGQQIAQGSQCCDDDPVGLPLSSSRLHRSGHRRNRRSTSLRGLSQRHRRPAGS
jgi:hypothetical protein